MLRQSLLGLILGLLILPTAILPAQLRPSWDTPEPEAPEIAPASPEAQQALATFRIPEGISAKLIAAEPMLANVVAFHIDHQGRIWACETFRQEEGVEDNRSHGHWLDDDLAAQTVEDRYQYILKHLEDDAASYALKDDRIRLLTDSDGDLVMDKAVVFADHFNEVVAGTGAGVLSYRDRVYYTNIPDLWMLQDTDGDGQADLRESLHYGFGVRFAFRGHDMHGLTLGPDGRIYFSIGDRGFNIETKSGPVVNPGSGGVFRCELDGSNLEVFATGLRNPQELAFDDYGNLFTGDNNSDSGDKARWVYVVEGGDTGWRMEYQYLSDRGPFNREKIWHPFNEDTPAYIIPPIANIADGPSGLAYYPGTGFGDKFKNHFFLCDFRGQPVNSGIRSIRLEPDGAFFSLAEDAQPFWSILATDVQFGPDGGLYASDWVNGWVGLAKGRIYRFASDDAADQAEAQQTQTLLAESFAAKDENELVSLLSHKDQRVRLEAQFELAGREAFEALDGVARNTGSLLARCHAIWGLEMMARHDARRASAAETFAELLRDREPEIRAQAVKMLGEINSTSYSTEVAKRLADPSNRVRYFAAVSLGKLEATDAIADVTQMLIENNNADPIVRHGGIRALAGLAAQGAGPIEALADHESQAVRLAATVALRRLKTDEVARFLTDPDTDVVLEAARAIHDLPLTNQLPALAALIESPNDSDALLRRVLNANYRLGQPDNAQALADYASRTNAPLAMRIEALDMLANWAAPNPRDRVLGMWRPLDPRDREPAATALRSALPAILGEGGEVATRAITVASQLGISEIVPTLQNLVSDTNQTDIDRANALRALSLMKAEGLPQLVNKQLDSSAVELRAAALDLLADFDPDAAIKQLPQRLASANVREQQLAIATLGKLDSPQADRLVADWTRKLADGNVADEIQLDVWSVAKQSQNAEVTQALADFEANWQENPTLGPYLMTRFGGDAQAGKRLFFERTSLSCVRCHQIGEVGGGVGPNLSGIGKDKDRDYLLEAVVAPTKTIAKGYESVIVQTIDGSLVTGIVKEETDDQLVLLAADGATITIPAEDIEDLVPGKSSMPEDLIKSLTHRELRDLIEFLKQQQTPVLTP